MKQQNLKPEQSTIAHSLEKQVAEQLQRVISVAVEKLAIQVLGYYDHGDLPGCDINGIVQMIQACSNNCTTPTVTRLCELSTAYWDKQREQELEAEREKYDARWAEITSWMR